MVVSIDQAPAAAELSITGCIFCDPDPHLKLFSTPNFAVILDKFPLMEGHLIIHSKKHWGCAGEVPAELFSELTALKDYTGGLIRDTYGQLSFYEHGRAGHCLSFGPDERLCHHFHLHALPLSDTISNALNSNFSELEIKQFDELPEMYNRFGEYLYFESIRSQKYFYPVTTEIESHLMRTIIANKIGYPDRANWENCHLPEMVETAKQNLRSSPPPFGDLESILT